MAKAKKGGLGRGLDALFADSVSTDEKNSIETKIENASSAEVAGKPVSEDRPGHDSVIYISVHDIKPNLEQPRKAFDEEKISELAASIKENGIIQPIIVRSSKNKYEIVAGERRWRAAIKAELAKVPCIIKELTEEQNMLFSIIENMQREDLNPIEEAEGINRMMFTFGLTQEEVSKSVGKSRPYIGNALRLLKLPTYIKDAMVEGKITMGHGRCLINVTDEMKRKAIAEKIINEGISVREAEKLASEVSRKPSKALKKPKNADLIKVEEELKESLGTKVNIVGSGKKGKIEIEFFSKDELERLIEILKALS